MNDFPVDFVAAFLIDLGGNFATGPAPCHRRGRLLQT